QIRRALLRCPVFRPAAGREKHHGWRWRRYRFEKPRGPLGWRGEHDGVGPVRCDAGPGVGEALHLHAPPAIGAQRRFDPGRAQLVVGQDEDRFRPPSCIGHGASTPAVRTKRATSRIGMARAREPTTMALRPMTWPDASASGPPALPHAGLTSAWIHERPPDCIGPTAWTIPTVSAPRTPRGWPTAATIEPTGAESPTEAAGMPVPRTRSRARSASVSRA